jgi:radical SAM protein with 4Fe4S-binding SPASM domain
MDQLHETSTQAMLDGLDRVKRGEKLGPYLARMFNKANKPLKKREWLGVTCGVCRNTTIVDNRGNLYPCHRYAEMKEYQIGNVFTGMDRQSVMNYYRKINSLACEECHDCWIRDYCAGGCAWLLSDKEGVLHHATPQECTRRRKSMERGLWLRKELRESFPQWFDEGAEVPLESWNWDCDEEEALFQHSQTSGTNAPNGQQPQLPLVPLSGQSCCSTEQSGKSSCGCGSSAGSDSEPHALVQLSANFNQTETINSAGGCTTCSDCGPECGSTTPHDQQATFYLEPIPGSSPHQEG